MVMNSCHAEKWVVYPHQLFPILAHYNNPPEEVNEDDSWIQALSGKVHSIVLTIVHEV